MYDIKQEKLERMLFDVEKVSKLSLECQGEYINKSELPRLHPFLSLRQQLQM